MKNRYKIPVILSIILIAFNSCWVLDEEEEMDCDECVSAQIHLCNALGRTNGRLDLAGDAVAKVKEACGDLGSKKVTEVHTKWLNNPTENCNSYYGFNCK